MMQKIILHELNNVQKYLQGNRNQDLKLFAAISYNEIPNEKSPLSSAALPFSCKDMAIMRAFFSAAGSCRDRPDWSATYAMINDQKSFFKSLQKLEGAYFDKLPLQ